MVVAIWGSTFVFTKLLLLGGLTPGQIFTQRFIIAYLLLLGYSLLIGKTGGRPFRLFSESCMYPPGSSLCIRDASV